MKKTINDSIIVALTHKELGNYTAGHIIQLEYAGDSLFILEYFEGEELPPFMQAPELPTPGKTKEQMELETALDTQLLKDPLGKYNNCNLRVPFDNRDKEWIDWVLENMHNKFIRDKVELIKRSGYGSIS